jgi:sporulation protein YlmC with PRC-barrel domain
MLIAAKALKGYRLKSLDGDIGSAREFYFDDRYWTIRYLVADTGGWLAGRHVLLSPYALASVNPDLNEVVVDLKKKQIEGSPSLTSDKPVSRQFEDSYYGYYGWPNYWTGPRSWGTYSYVNRGRETWSERREGEENWDRHLRSTKEVSGYHVQAQDGQIGHVSDFIVDDKTWSIRYLVVDTTNWMPGRKVLISPDWFGRVSWTESKIFTSHTREAVRLAPEYTPEALITRDYETALFEHYKHPGYWADELVNH